MYKSSIYNIYTIFINLLSTKYCIESNFYVLTTIKKLV